MYDDNDVNYCSRATMSRVDQPNIKRIRALLRLKYKGIGLEGKKRKKDQCRIDFLDSVPIISFCPLKSFLLKFKGHVVWFSVRRASCQAVSRCDVYPAAADTTTQQPVFAPSPPLDSTGCHRRRRRRRHGYGATYANDAKSWKRDSFREFRPRFARRVRRCRRIDRASSTETPPPERPR